MRAIGALIAWIGLALTVAVHVDGNILGLPEQASLNLLLALCITVFMPASFLRRKGYAGRVPGPLLVLGAAFTLYCFLSLVLVKHTNLGSITCILGPAFLYSALILTRFPGGMASTNQNKR